MMWIVVSRFLFVQKTPGAFFISDCAVGAAAVAGLVFAEETSELN